MKPTYDHVLRCPTCKERYLHIVDTEFVFGGGKEEVLTVQTNAMHKFSDTFDLNHHMSKEDPNYPNLSKFRVNVRDAEEKDLDGISTNDLYREPAIKIHMSCEFCETSGAVLCLFQHKGGIFIETYPE